MNLDAICIIYMLSIAIISGIALALIGRYL